MTSLEGADLDSTPVEMFSTVWVKMEVDENGTVEGLDSSSSEESGENNTAKDVKAPLKRNRRKPARPRKAKNVEEKYFQCSYCNYKALHKGTLNYHMMKHVKPTPVQCTLCSYTTNHAASLRRHMLGVHTDVNDPIVQAMKDKKCKDCDFTTKFSWKLVVHRRKHKYFQCDQCEYATGRKTNLQKHLTSHRSKNAGMYECDKCSFMTKHEGHITRHLAVVHNDVAPDACRCDYCEFSTKVRWRLNVHKKNSRQEKPIKCEFCDFITDYNCQFKLHKQQHINDIALSSTGLELLKDDKNYSPNKMKADMSSAEPLNDKEFIVDMACEEIDWGSIEVGEKPGQEKPFYCIVCPYTSRFKAAVQRHYQRNHTSNNSKPYKCVNCNFSTKTRDQIALHNKRSKSIYQTCKVCDFATYYKCQMAEHQKTHWQFNCKLCEYVCRVKYDLNQHYAVVHLGQTLKCRYCDFKAARKDTLMNHESIHSNKRFQCDLCGYTATRRNLVFNHTKRNHPGERPCIVSTDKLEPKLSAEESGNNEREKNIEGVKEEVENT